MIKRIKDIFWATGWIILFYTGLLPAHKKASKQTRKVRYDTCKACPIFKLPWRTCGFHHEFLPDGTRMSLGCGCFLPVKTALLKATCWQRDHGFAEGWSDSVNGKDI